MYVHYAQENPEKGILNIYVINPFTELFFTKISSVKLLQVFATLFQHCSSHMNETDLKGIIEWINPNLLFPICTEHIGMFRPLTARKKMEQEGEVYEF